METISVAQLLGRIGSVESPGRFQLRKAGSRSSLVQDVLSEPAIDASRMSVRMRISTDTIDRDGHIVEQSTILTDNYRANPAVLLSHGEDYSLPVAVSESPEGEFTVTRQEDGTYATAYHKSQDEMSSQVFDAVACGLLRASSIGIDPLGAMIKIIDGEEVLIVTPCDMTEWSYAAIGVNPQALVKSHRARSNGKLLESWALQCEAASRILHRGTLDGRPILPALRKSISGLLVPQGSVTGHTPERKVMKKQLTKEAVSKFTARQLVKAMSEMGEYDEASQAVIKEAAAGMPDETPASGESPETTPDDMPLGARVVAGVHEQLKQLISTAENAMGPVENPDVKEKLEEELAKLNECVVSVEGLFASAYPEQPALKMESAEVDGEMVKSFLAGNSRSQNCLTGHSQRLTILATQFAGKVPPNSLKAMLQTATDLSRLCTQAKSYKPSQSGLDVKAAEAQIARLEASLKAIVEKLDSTPA